jgi:outer membrane receptor protein involved in Fe transport
MVRTRGARAGLTSRRGGNVSRNQTLPKHIRPGRARQATLDGLRLLALLAAAVPCLAQAEDANAPDAGAPAPAAAPDAPSASSGQLQSITVTATKRTEDIKDIPTSVSALDADQLADHHIANYDDITRAVPSVSFQAGAGPGLDNIEIRGVSSTSGAATVGIYVDEVSVTVKNTYDGAVEPKLFDLDRVEVLRGPQGTLYGASSMGGTIRFITKQPDVNAFSGSASTDLSYTKHGSFNDDSNAVINVPIVPGTFALRLGADVSYQSGYIDNYQGYATGFGPNVATQTPTVTLNTNDSTGVLLHKGVNDEHTEVFKMAGKYVGPADLTITPALLFQRTATGDGGIFYPTIGLYEQTKRIGEPGKDILTVPSLTINKGFDFADLTSVTSYFRRDFHRTTDGTYYNSNAFVSFYLPPNNLADNIIGFLPSPVYYDTTTDQFSQEVRLASKDAKLAGFPITWQGGLYFSNLRQTHTDDEYIPGFGAQFQQIFGESPSAYLGSAYPGVTYANDLIYLAHNHLQERQIAPFGEAGIDLTSQLKATLGARYVTAKTSYGFTSAGFYAFGLPNPYAPPDVSFEKTTPKASLEYAVNKDVNIYTSIAKGFRLGGPTGPDPVGPGNTCTPDYQRYNISSAPLSYDSDSLWSYEVGTKGRYFNKHVSVNADVYAIDWSNIQQSVNLPSCGFSFTTNAGDAKIYGSELEFRWAVSSELTVSVNGGTTHTYVTRSAYPSIVAVGESLLNVPSYTVTPSLDYDFPINDLTQGFVRADFPYTGKSRAYFDSSGLPNLYSPNYGVLNLNLGVTRQKLTVGIYGKNLANSKKIIQYPSVNSVQEAFTLRPLTVGVTAAYQF